MAKTPQEKRVRFIELLRRLAKEVDDVGIHEVDIEDGELAWILNHAADQLEKQPCSD